MADRDPDELVIAGSGDLYFAPYGTVLPDEDTAVDAALNGAFVKAGYVSEDGLTFGFNPTVEEFFAWQSRSPVRREMTGTEYMLGFTLEQWNSDNIILAFGGGSAAINGAGDVLVEFLQQTDQLDEVSAVCDWNDGTKKYRLVVARATISDSVEVQLQRNELAMLPVNLRTLDPGENEREMYLITDDPAFLPAS